MENMKAIVDELIDLLGLEKVWNTRIGSDQVRGISGGEKKRVNIGVELIQTPNLLFLDEPTTGLDSYTAYQIMQLVQKLKQTGITIISTIHSPTNKILNLFDKVIILGEGKVLYDGPPFEI